MDIRLALSGAGTRIPGHVGVLQACEDLGVNIREIAGTSAGSICGALYASGMKAAEMKQLAFTMDWNPLIGLSLESLLEHEALNSGDNVLSFLQQHTGGKRFSDIGIDLKIIAMDLLTEQEIVFSRDASPSVTLADAARASSSIPVVFPPMQFSNALCVDGGTGDNVPASHLTIDELPRFEVYLKSEDPPLTPGDYGFLTVLPRIIDSMLSANESLRTVMDSEHGVHIITVPTPYASSLDKSMPLAIRQRLFDDGYAAMKQALSVVI